MTSNGKLFFARLRPFPTVTLPVLAAVLIFGAAPAGAVVDLAQRPELYDARALALGGAGRSLSPSPTAGRMNPAAIAGIRGFYGGATYLTRDEETLDALRVTVVDNSSSPVAGALMYSRMVAGRELEDIGLVLAAGANNQWWGATTRYVHGRDSSSDEWDGAFVGDIGVLVQREWLRIAVVGHDLFASTLDFLETRLALGLSTDFYGFTLAGDYVRHLDTDLDHGQDTHVGVEYTPKGSKWSLRAGQVWEGATDEDAFTWGIGWTYKTLELGYGWMKTRQEPGPTVHVFSVRGSF